MWDIYHGYKEHYEEQPRCFEAEHIASGKRYRMCHWFALECVLALPEPDSPLSERIEIQPDVFCREYRVVA